MIDYLSDVDVDINHFNEIYPEILSESQSKYYDSNSFKLLDNKTPNDIAILGINIRSLHGKLDELQAWITLLECRFDIICVAETWLTNSTINMCKLNNYEMFNVIRTDVRGGGVGIYAHEDYDSSILSNISFSYSHIESVFIKCLFRSKTLVIGCIYRPPSGDVNMFLESMDTILTALSHLPQSNLYVCGDFNLNLLNVSTDSNCNNFLNLMFANSLSPIITKPTRINDPNNSCTLIDNIFTQNPVHYISGILVTDLSDHYPVFGVFRNVFPDVYTSNLTPFKIQYRLLNENTLNSLCLSLSSYDFSDVMQLEDVNEAFSLFNNTVMNFYNVHCPILSKTHSYKKYTKPWIDGEVINEIKRRDNYLKLLRVGRMNKVTFNRLRNKVTKLIRSKKKSYYELKFNELRGDIKRTWSLINNVIGTSVNNKRGNILKLNVNNNIITDPQDIANALNDHFATVGTKIANSFSSAPSGYMEFLSGSYPHSFFLSPVSVSNVIEYIKSLKNKKCSVQDLPSMVVKYLSNVIAPVLCALINLSLSEGVFPDCFKLARVVPLFKGGDNLCLNNYRPISILNIFSKILEKHVCNQLYLYIENNEILNDSQFGFRHCRGTTQALLRHTGFIYKELDMSNIVFSMYLDFSKAFDSVNHDILLSKLEFYGVRGLSLQWFKSYLSNRKQYVYVNDRRSSISEVQYSVPQGSNLGPLLFLVFINDLPNCTDYFEYGMFADDCTVSCSIAKNDFETSHLPINLNLECIRTWLNSNRIMINTSKTNYMLYSYRGNPSFHSPIKVGNSEVDQRASVKFLGVILDERLKYDMHVQMISQKIARNVGVLFKLCQVIPENILRNLYYTLIGPYIAYAIEVWYSAPNCISNKIKVLQKKAIRCIKNLNYDDHTIQHFKNMKILPIGDLYEYSLSVYMYRTINFVEYDVDLSRSLVGLNDQHNHLTRNRFEYLIPRLNKEKTAGSMHYKGVKNWNNLPPHFKDYNSLKLFKIKLRQHMLTALC